MPKYIKNFKLNNTSISVNNISKIEDFGSLFLNKAIQNVDEYLFALQKKPFKPNKGNKTGFIPPVEKDIPEEEVTPVFSSDSSYENYTYANYLSDMEWEAEPGIYDLERNLLVSLTADDFILDREPYEYTDEEGESQYVTCVNNVQRKWNKYVREVLGKWSDDKFNIVLRIPEGVTNPTVIREYIVPGWNGSPDTTEYETYIISQYLAVGNVVNTDCIKLYLPESTEEIGLPKSSGQGIMYPNPEKAIFVKFPNDSRPEVSDQVFNGTSLKYIDAKVSQIGEYSFHTRYRGILKLNIDCSGDILKNAFFSGCGTKEYPCRAKITAKNIYKNAFQEGYFSKLEIHAEELKESSLYGLTVDNDFTIHKEVKHIESGNSNFYVAGNVIFENRDDEIVLESESIYSKNDVYLTDGVRFSTTGGHNYFLSCKAVYYTDDTDTTYSPWGAQKAINPYTYTIFDGQENPCGLISVTPSQYILELEKEDVDNLTIYLPNKTGGNSVNFLNLNYRKIYLPKAGISGTSTISSVDEIIFSSEQEVLNAYAISVSPKIVKKITISEGTKVINGGAFANGYSLIIVPNTVEEVKDSAFYGCDTVVYNGTLDTSKWGAKKVIPSL